MFYKGLTAQIGGEKWCSALTHINDFIRFLIQKQTSRLGSRGVFCWEAHLFSLSFRFWCVFMVCPDEAVRCAGWQHQRQR